MSLEGASLKKTNDQIWRTIEMLRAENHSAAALIDRAMKSGGRVRVEVDDTHATRNDTPRSSEPRVRGMPVTHSSNKKHFKEFKARETLALLLHLQTAVASTPTLEGNPQSLVLQEMTLLSGKLRSSRKNARLKMNVKTETLTTLAFMRHSDRGSHGEASHT
jgi:hypothetical protein